MAEEAPKYQKEFIEEILNPENLATLYGLIPSGKISLLVYDTIDKDPREAVLENITSFMTLNDIKLAIYELMKEDPIALPDHTFVATASEIKRGKFSPTRLIPLDYDWSTTLKPGTPLELANPINLIKRKTKVLDTRFVEPSGQQTILRSQWRDRMLFESSHLKGLSNPPILHVFFYRVVESAIPGERPIGELDWNGYLRPYFPKLSVESFSPSDEDIRIQKQRLKGFVKKREFYNKLNGILGKELLFPLTLTGIRFLRIHYEKPTKIPGIETIFYNAPVNSTRPYMRLLPANSSPISKIHMIEDKPNIEDPRLLLQWGQERLITPERDSAFVKILLRKQSGSISPLYVTLRLLDDGTADLTVEPPKSIRKLDPRSELDNLPGIIQTALDGFPYLNEKPNHINGTFIFALNLKEIVAPLTQRVLREKLPIFSSIFQEIPALPGETPLLMLRYKLISNFTNEDRIQSFITQVLSKKLLFGDTNYSDIVDLVSEDFDISVEEAQKYVADKLKGVNDIRPTLIKEKGDPYVVQSNPGIDIGIFSQHPLYSFHVYRLDSQETLKRIVTFLSILFSCPLSTLSVAKSAARDILVSEKEIVEEEEDKEEENDDFKSVAEIEAEPDAEAFEDLMFANADAPTLQEEADMADVEVGSAVSESEEEERPESFREKLAKDVEKPAIVAKTLEPAKKELPEPKEEAKLTSYEKYFSDKLKDADRGLFDFHKTHPSLKNYVTQCQSNLMRQPAVLNEEQFQAMVKAYDSDLKPKADGSPPEIAFYVFPLSNDAKKEPYNPGTKEYYTLMKYGTSERVSNYYLCCKYFCTRDNIMVREKDLRGTVLRRPVKNADGTFRTVKKGEDKATGFDGSCPFCEGEVIQNRRFPGTNQTVIERNVKPGTVDKRHEYIRFLKKTNHPDGFFLPCCFIEDQPVRIGDPGFPADTSSHAPDVLSLIQAEGDTSSSTTTVAKKALNYEDFMLSAPTAYIVGAEKFPLEGIVKGFKKLKKGETIARSKLSEPQIGLLPLELNPYFLQDSIELVSRTFNPQKLKEGAMGFLRIGVENTSRSANDSFLSAVAPFFGEISAKTFKETLGKIILPKLFVTLNYGNLLLEMYDPNSERPPINDELRDWARDNLSVRKITTNNEELVVRAFMSYGKFMDWLESDTTKKEPRHFTNLFMQPNILKTALGRVAQTGEELQGNRPGIIFIILDVLKSGEVKIRCPQYPINHDMYAKSDFGFLFHHYTGVWEPIFFVDNRVPAQRTFSSYLLTFSNSHISKWPAIIQKRIKEFTEQCRSTTGGKGYYTSASHVSSKKCIGNSILKQHLDASKEISFYGTIRDSYNHMAALVYKAETSNLVAIPVVDDGLSPLIDGNLILDWDDFTSAPADQVLNFYKKYMYPRYAEQYTIISQVKSLGSQKIEAFQLKNGLFVPIVPNDKVDLGLPVDDVAEMEWSINRNIIMGESTTPPELPGEEIQMHTKEMNEIYEHLRLTFSNKLNVKAGGGELRENIEKTIYRNDLPLFEKRKRLEILLSPIIEGVLSEKDEDAKISASLLRVDCTLRPESECNGQCVWTKTGESASKCLIHVPKHNDASVSATHILLLRLIEELLRYGVRRKQLFDQKVSQLAVLDDPVRIDDQYIIPEKSSAWANLLRLEWFETNSAKPLYLEEMSELNPAIDAALSKSITHLPIVLKDFLGEDPLVERLHLYPSATSTVTPFLSLLNVLPADIGLNDQSREMTEAEISLLVRKTKMPIVQIDLRKEQISVISKQAQRDLLLGYPVFVLRDEIPISLLVRDTENPTILVENDIPAKLVSIIKGSTKLFIKMGA